MRPFHHELVMHDILVNVIADNLPTYFDME